MRGKLLLMLLAVCSWTFGQNDVFGTDIYTIATDDASNYTTATWTTGSNQGTGFGNWGFSSSGGGSKGSYIGSTGLGDPSFGIFAEAFNTFTAARPFNNPLKPGESVSVNIGATSVSGGAELLVQLVSSSTIVFTLKYVGGTTNWVINDGGSDFSSGEAFAANSSINFTFTYEGNNDYSYNLGSNSGSNFTANSIINSVDEIRFVNNGQGSGQNFGFNNLQITTTYTIPSGVISDVTSDITAPYLEIDGTLNIKTANSLTLEGDLRNDGTINVEDNASLVQTAASTNNSGSGTYNVIKQKVFEDYRRFVYVSSPVQGESLGDAFPNSNTNDFYAYDPSNQNDSTGTPWISHGAATAMNPGRGYTTTPNTSTTSGSFVQVTETPTFTGTTVNNGNITYSAGTVVPYDPAEDNGFVLAGNPYPSAIDATTFLNSNSGLTGTIWFWDHNSTNINDADYATWTTAGGVAAYSGGDVPNGSIASGQAFMVEPASTPTSSLDINFTNAMRVAGNNNQLFKTENRERFWVKVNRDTSASSQILVALMDGASESEDLNDGRKFKAGQEISFYSVLAADHYAIQALPKFSPSVQKRVIPLGIDAWKTGQYTIALDSLNNWQSANYIYLLDSAQGKVIDLQQNDYTFAVNQIGVIHNRFYLAIGQTGQSNVSIDESGKSGELHYYQKEDHLLLNDALSQMALKSARVISLGGVPVLEADLNSNATEHQLNVGHLANGVYMLQVEAQDGALHTYKVYLR